MSAPHGNSFLGPYHPARAVQYMSMGTTQLDPRSLSRRPQGGLHWVPGGNVGFQPNGTTLIPHTAGFSATSQPVAIAPAGIGDVRYPLQETLDQSRMIAEYRYPFQRFETCEPERTPFHTNQLQVYDSVEPQQTVGFTDHGTVAPGAQRSLAETNIPTVSSLCRKERYLLPASSPAACSGEFYARSVVHANTHSQHGASSYGVDRSNSIMVAGANQIPYVFQGHPAEFPAGCAVAMVPPSVERFAFGRPTVGGPNETLAGGQPQAFGSCNEFSTRPTCQIVHPAPSPIASNVTLPGPFGNQSKLAANGSSYQKIDNGLGSLLIPARTALTDPAIDRALSHNSGRPGYAIPVESPAAQCSSPSPRWLNMLAEAEESRREWVHPEGSVQAETDVLHLCRAVLKMKQAGLTKSFFTSHSDVSQRAFSNYIKGRFKGNQKLVEEKLLLFLKLFAEGKFDTDLFRSGEKRGESGLRNESGPWAQADIVHPTDSTTRAEVDTRVGASQRITGRRSRNTHAHLSSMQPIQASPGFLSKSALHIVSNGGTTSHMPGSGALQGQLANHNNDQTHMNEPVPPKPTSAHGIGQQVSSYLPIRSSIASYAGASTGRTDLNYVPSPTFGHVSKLSSSGPTPSQIHPAPASQLPAASQNINGTSKEHGGPQEVPLNFGQTPRVLSSSRIPAPPQSAHPLPFPPPIQTSGVCFVGCGPQYTSAPEPASNVMTNSQQVQSQVSSLQPNRQRINPSTVHSASDLNHPGTNVDNAQRRQEPMYGFPLPEQLRYMTPELATEQAFFAFTANKWTEHMDIAEPLLVPVEIFVKINELLLHTFTQWDVREDKLSPEIVATRIVRSRGLPDLFLIPVAAALRRRLYEAGIVPPPPPTRENGSRENLWLVKLVVELEGDFPVQVFRTSFEWDIGAGSMNSPELFAQSLCSDAGISMKHVATVARAIRHRLSCAHAIAHGDKETRAIAEAEVLANGSFIQKLRPIECLIRDLSAGERRMLEREEGEITVRNLFVKPLLDDVMVEASRREMDRERAVALDKQRKYDEIARARAVAVLEKHRLDVEESLKEYRAIEARLLRDSCLDIKAYSRLKLGYDSHPGIWIEGILERQRRGVSLFPAAGLAFKAIRAAKQRALRAEQALATAESINNNLSLFQHAQEDPCLMGPASDMCLAVSAVDYDKQIEKIWNESGFARDVSNFVEPCIEAKRIISKPSIDDDMSIAEMLEAPCRVQMIAGQAYHEVAKSNIAPKTGESQGENIPVRTPRKRGRPRKLKPNGKLNEPILKRQATECSRDAVMDVHIQSNDETVRNEGNGAPRLPLRAGVIPN